MVVAYFLTFATLTVLAHEAYRTTAFDLGSMDQAIWNTLHGRFFRATVQPGVEIRLVGHVEPILLPISLLYLIYSDPKVLLVLQSAVVALGALPAYWLARDLLRRPRLALVFPLRQRWKWPQPGSLLRRQGCRGTRRRWQSWGSVRRTSGWVSIAASWTR